MIKLTALHGELHITPPVAAVSPIDKPQYGLRTLVFLPGNPNPFRVAESVQKVLSLLAHHDPLLLKEDL